MTIATTTPLRAAVLRGDWAAVDRQAGPADPADGDALTRFAARVRTADTAQFAAWGINSPALVADVKRLFNTPWTAGGAA